MASVISGAQLKGVRARSNLSNQQLANLLGESLSTVNRWLANGVRPEKEAKVRERLAVWMPPTETDRYTQMSDAALLAEMTRLLGIIGQRLAGRVSGHIADTGSEGYEVSATVDRSDKASPDPGGQHKSEPRRIRGRGPRIT